MEDIRRFCLVRFFQVLLILCLPTGLRSGYLSRLIGRLGIGGGAEGGTGVVGRSVEVPGTARLLPELFETFLVIDTICDIFLDIQRIR